jgi:NitT/TauT family transport system substrate-binding protein
MSFPARVATATALDHRVHASPRAVHLLFVLLAIALALGAIPTLGLGGLNRAGAQTTLSCEPLVPPGSATPAAATESAEPPAPAEGELTEITVGYVPVSIYAPVFVALDKGYYAEQGLDVTLEPFAGGPDPIILTGSGELDFAAIGAGPAFWNAAASGLPISIVAPGHAEGSPVATPLMISKESCASGAITSVADLEGKRVSVNARGATEYWLGQALATGGLTIDDVDLQVLPFPDAVAALASGAIDAAMVGEPLATLAEQEGTAVRLLSDFPVQGLQPTAIIGNKDFIAANPEAAQGFVTAYLQASRDLSGDGFKDPAHLAIIEAYTNVPAALVAAAVQPVYAVNGEINVEGLGILQTFFRERDQLEYDEDLDPASLVDTTFVDGALETLGPVEG